MEKIKHMLIFSFWFMIGFTNRLFSMETVSDFKREFKRGQDIGREWDKKRKDNK